MGKVLLYKEADKMLYFHFRHSIFNSYVYKKKR